MSLEIKDEDGDILHLGTHPSNSLLIMEVIDRDEDGMLRFNKEKGADRLALFKLCEFINAWLVTPKIFPEQKSLGETKHFGDKHDSTTK